MFLLPILAAVADDTASRLQDAIVDHVAATLRVPEADVEVVHLGAAWLSCADPGQERLIVEAKAGEDFLGSTDLRVTVLDGQSVCGKYRIKPKIARWVSVPVAKEAAAPGASVVLSLQRVRLDSSTAAPVDPDGGPYLALTTIRAGEPVIATRVRSRPDVGGGTSITVEIHSGGLLIRCDGVLVGDAHIGEPVRARCNTTGQVVHGTLTSPTRVVAGG